MYHFLFIFCSLFLSNLHAIDNKEPEPNYTVVEDAATTPILTPSLQNQVRHKIRLSNHLEAYLISDPDAEKSATALCVGVGSWDNPDDAPGLAHFLEHMLFLGTEEFPEEDSYSKFVRDHGGRSNAYTADTVTNYMFEIEHNALPEALQRFSAFFKSPLLSFSGVDRELQAVDQEYRRGIENDRMRSYYVLKQMANSDHPFSKFNVGNQETLANVAPETLRAWFEKYYSSDSMKLVIYSNLPIETLLELTVDNFAEIPKRPTSQSEHPKQFLQKELSGQFIYSAPIKELRTISLYWELPKQFANMPRTRPGSVISHLLGNEDPNSLLSELQREGLATSLTAGGRGMNKKHYLLELQVSLTQKGWTKRNTVIERCFQAIKEFSFNPVPRYVFDEINKMDRIHYQYQSRQNPFHWVSSLAAALQEESIETFPEYTQILQAFNPDTIQDALEYMTPENTFFLLTAPKNDLPVNLDRQDPWLHVPYTIRNMEASLLAHLQNCDPHPSIKLPDDNPFIPDNLTLLTQSDEKSTQEIPVPDCVVDNDFGQLYHSRENPFQVPEGFVKFRILSPLFESRIPESSVMLDLLTECLEESLKPQAYPALLAGLASSISTYKEGLSIEVNGYSDKLCDYFQKIAIALTTSRPTEEQFDTYKETLSRYYQNFEKEAPLQQSVEHLKEVLYKNYQTRPQKLAIIENITHSEFLSFLDLVWKNTYVEGLVYGNLTQKEAKKLWETLSAQLNSDPYPKADHHKREVVILPQHHGPYFVASTTERQGNAVLLTIQNGTSTLKARGALDILTQALQQPLFSELRTKQQTAYEVWNLSQEIEKQLYSFLGIQSASHDVRDLLARFELFLETFLQTMPEESLPLERFQTIKQSIISELSQAPNTLSSMGALLYELAYNFDGEFDRITNRIQALNELDYKQFIETAQNMLGRSNRQRLAILMKGRIAEPDSFIYQRAKSFSHIKDLSDYINKKPEKDLGVAKLQSIGLSYDYLKQKTRKI